MDETVFHPVAMAVLTPGVGACSWVGDHLGRRIITGEKKGP